MQRDKKQYWQLMSDSLEKEFCAHNLHSVYRRLNMQDELERTQPLGAGLLRAPEGGFARTSTDRNNILIISIEKAHSGCKYLRTPPV